MNWPAHEVFVLCDCGDAEDCRLELYVSDVRLAYAEIERLERELAEMQAA